MIESNKTLPKVGIGVLIVNEKNEILLGLRKSKHGVGLWGPPGGHLELMESFEDCAIRETHEETGLKIETPKFFALTNDAYEEESKHYISIFMLARLLNNQQVINSEPNNFQEWRWFNPQDLPNNLFLPLKQLVSDKAYGQKLLKLKTELPCKETLDSNIFIFKPDDPNISDIITDGLKEYNQSKIGAYEIIPFNIYATNTQEKVIAGIKGEFINQLIRINSVWVDENNRNKSIGTKLFQALEVYAKKHEYKVIQLFTTDFQAPSFYEKLGFTYIAKVDRVFVSGKTDFFMRKYL